MKKIFLLLLLVPMFNFAQDREKAVTTDEEYLYLTQGYRITLATGLDVKNGYSLTHLPEVTSENHIIRYSLLKDVKTSKTKAVLITLTKDKSRRDKVVYLCLPFNNKKLLEKFYLAANSPSVGASMTDVLEVSIYNMLASTLDKVTNSTVN